MPRRGILGRVDTWSLPFHVLFLASQHSLFSDLETPGQSWLAATQSVPEGGVSRMLGFHSGAGGGRRKSPLYPGAAGLTQTVRIVHREKEHKKLFDSSGACWKCTPHPLFSFYKETLHRDRKVCKKTPLTMWLAYAFGIRRNLA